MEIAPIDLEAYEDELQRLRKWVTDLQSGMYINCVYCGHRYSPNAEVPTAELLRSHVEECPEHPASKLKAKLNKIAEIVGSFPLYSDGPLSNILKELWEIQALAGGKAGQ